jgi:RimJ/RimL family protein N-acetyltransferase
MILRKVRLSDVDTFLAWRNEEDVRKNSFHSEPIKHEDHVRWFTTKINSETCRIFVLEDNNIPAGQVRIDIEGPVGVISYSLDNKYRGRGLGREILLQALEFLRVEGIALDYLRALVKPENIASQRTLERIGFLAACKTTKSIEYRKALKLDFHEKP